MNVPQPKGYAMGYSPSTTSTHSRRTAQSTAQFLLPHLAPTDRVLDIGCGPGSITCGFAALVPAGSVTGIDLSAAVVARANASAAEQGIGNVTFQVGDVLAGLPFPDASFDVVFSSQTLIHIWRSDDRRCVQAIAEMRRVLKPGGIFASSEACALHWHPYGEELHRVWTRRLERGIGAPLGGARIRGWLREAGFAAEKVRIGGGATVAADAQSCKDLAESNIGRLAKGDQFRQSWLDVGISEEECDESQLWLRKWADSEDAWYSALQSEVLAWK